MKKNYLLILGAALFLCALLFFINLYLGAIGAVILIALAMSVFIMQETRVLPDVAVQLRDDAKGIVLVNRGNAPAYKIHVALVPLNIEFDKDTLAPDASFEFSVESMINEAKAVVEFQDETGARRSRTYALSALGTTEEDLLKPVFPLFHWK
jgi:hypothetical protein